MTVFSLVVCALMILVRPDHRPALIIFCVGSGLGYFLELWGTTRLCWVYYTGGTPPLFTVLAHGMASLAIWRVYGIYRWWIKRTDTQWVLAILPEEKV